MSQVPKILIVDDEKDNLDALRRLLRKNYEVFAALSGEEGLALLKQPELRNLDVVISDQRMPGMQGSEFLEQVSHVDPVATRVLLTGFSDIEAVVDAVNRGQIWRYISKPWEPEEFLMTVGQAAERARMTRSLKESRRELEKAVTELRAKDWARERLLLLLLHEFKTAPQILEGIKELGVGAPEAETQRKFIDNLERRFTGLTAEISTFLDEEKKFSQLPKSPLNFLDFSRAFALTEKIPFHGPANESEAPMILSHAESLQHALKHFLTILGDNTLKIPAELFLEYEPSSTDAFLLLALNAEKFSTLPLPNGLSREQSDPKLAWPLLLEPFVGSDPIERHHSGLRTESAKFVRQLSGLGAKIDFHIDLKSKRIELLLAFKTSLT